MVAEQLDLSDGQKLELQNLLQAEQEQVAALHQDLNSTDAQKSARLDQAANKGQVCGWANARAETGI